ncbi:FAD-binding oxidoreductase [Aquicoccus porphyridii]|uniref:FAD-binding oxidoreductase n=1 Tax=Aquicoccus porphyridii TaxID=1852029 RepID=A0A5A9Z5F4_9RHOB|nr:FAD-binding oxidoreductase [Aquicoccus porphyridii]KAA0912420.1 FAD-binding oxidoreductase [Aquicoccus porphyridii]RAI53102.1 hydroxyacid dehydrogenase [Rhodobacteraceae bacterium AsT-22]
MMLNPVDDSFRATLARLLPDRALRPIAPHYLEEPRGKWTGRAGVVVAPATVEEVSVALGAANAARVPVVPYGGGTGLVCAQVMPDGPDPMILSLERMTAIRGIYPRENVAIVEAGAILSDIHDAAARENRLFPLSIAAKGSARIGGNLATNAGGVNVLRYGNARELCLGIEAVLPDGRVMNTLSRLRKDNTGYDLRDLLIGSEGTLGVITAASLKLAPLPAATGTAILVVESPAAALDLLAMTRDQVGEAVSAFELINGAGFAFLREVMPEVRLPFATDPDWCVLVELGLPRGLDPAETLEALFADALEAGLVSDGIIAQSLAQHEALWEIREQLPEANRRIGSISSHDISLPLSALPDFIARADAALPELGEFRTNCFGHLGDGNLHYNVFPLKGRNRADYPGMDEKVQRLIHDITVGMSGSFSAEHGLGRLKTGDLERYGDPVKLALMRQIKQLFDPNGIMNPGAVLRG